MRKRPQGGVSRIQGNGLREANCPPRRRAYIAQRAAPSASRAAPSMASAASMPASLHYLPSPTRTVPLHLLVAVKRILRIVPEFPRLSSIFCRCCFEEKIKNKFVDPWHRRWRARTRVGCGQPCAWRLCGRCKLGWGSGAWPSGSGACPR
jgi:hypothetical protein